MDTMSPHLSSNSVPQTTSLNTLGNTHLINKLDKVISTQANAMTLSNVMANAADLNLSSDMGLNYIKPW